MKPAPVRPSIDPQPGVCRQRPLAPIATAEAKHLPPPVPSSDLPGYRPNSFLGGWALGAGFDPGKDSYSALVSAFSYPWIPKCPRIPAKAVP